jgi:hypothetical protein
MIRVRTSLAAAFSVLSIGLAPQAQAQFVRTGPRVTGTGAHPIAPPKAPAPEVAPVTVTADQPPAPPAAKAADLPVDGALPGGVLGPGDEGVGALIRRPEPAPAQLAETSKTDAAPSTGAVSDAPGGKADGAPAPEAKAALPHHAARHRPRVRKPAGQPQS